VAHFPAPDALAARMRAAGFDAVTGTPLTLGIAAIHVGVQAGQDAPAPGLR
jgi:ubiquinone/menaquinone biosynthesis C-methylase UbiE